MLNEETKRKLRLMNLAPVIDIVDQQDSDVQTVALPFDQRFQRIVDFLYQEKYNEKVKRLVKSARLRFPKADVHDIYYSPNRKINRDIMNELATCRYISENKNVVLQGYTSSGKTYLGCALGKEACRQHYRTRYIRLPDLLDEVKEKATEVYGRNKLLKKFAAYDVLILDEWLMADLKKDDVAFLFDSRNGGLTGHPPSFALCIKRKNGFRGSEKVHLQNPSTNGLQHMTLLSLIPAK